MKKIKIALVIKTERLEYDDRVRKEILTIQKLYPQVSFKIFVMFPENKVTQGVTDYGTPFESVYLPSRDKYPSGRKAVLKSFEFFKAIREDLKAFDAVWCANDDTAMVAALVNNKHLLWDLHEIPSSLTGNIIKKSLLRYIFSRCKVVVHANPQREKYLERIGVVNIPEKHYAIRNYPNFSDRDTEIDDHYRDFVIWRGDRTCVYLQGLANDTRAAYESIAAVLRFPQLSAVVVGGFDKDSRDRLEREFGDSFANRVYFVGKIPQLKIPQYVEQCFMSLVFYKNVSPNNYYCEANRFYQSVILGLPVVVGDNPSMKELVDKYGFGVSIEDDGKDVNKIVSGIEDVINHYERYRTNIKKGRTVLNWESQEETFRQIFNTLMS